MNLIEKLEELEEINPEWKKVRSVMRRAMYDIRCASIFAATLVAGDSSGEPVRKVLEDLLQMPYEDLPG